jgi:hypothetical protein
MGSNTFDKGNKSKAAICGNTLYFLSDYDRGHGFSPCEKWICHEAKKSGLPFARMKSIGKHPPICSKIE